MLRNIGRLVSELANVYRSTPLSCGIEYTLLCATRTSAILREKSLRPVDEAMGRSAYCFYVNGSSFMVPASAFGLAREIVARRIYELDDRFEIRDKDRVLDLGANVGVFSGLAAALGATVVAIEAQSKFISELLGNMARNGWAQRVRAIHGIIAPESGLFSVDRERARASHWDVEPPVIGLSALLAELGWEEVDLMKVDIEGSEFGLFSGSDDWVYRVRRLVMEVHADYGHVGSLCARLRDRGFSVLLTDLERSPVAQLAGEFGYIYAIR